MSRREAVIDSPFVLTIYDKAFVRRGWVGDYEQFTVTPRHLAIGTASLTVAADHPRLPHLLADGARMTVDYDRQQILSGPITAQQGTFPTSTSTVTITVEDDIEILGQVLGWPVPGAAIGAQSAQTHDVRTGPAETVIKQLVQANAVGRLALPLTIAPSPTPARGSTVTAQIRMEQLRDVLIPLATAGGVGISVRQVGPGLVLDCYVPTVRPRVLSEESGVLVGGSWSKRRASATRVVVGGQGDGTARVFRLVTDPALETALGTKLEAFRDATDTGSPIQLDDRGRQTLAEGAPAAGISLQLAETATFRYGRTVRVGDIVTVQLATGVTVTDVLGSAVLTHSRTDGFAVSPRVGDDTASAEPNAVIGRALWRVASTVRKIGSRR